MKNLTTFLSVVLLLSLWSCKPEPFKSKLAGYNIQFPVSMVDLQTYHPNGYRSWSNRFIDSNQTIRIEWWSEDWGGSGNRDPKNQPYGVGIFLKNKGNQFDSVKTALEKQYGRNLLLLNVTRLGKYEPYQPIPAVYTCRLNKNTILALSKASRHRGDPWSQYNSVRISIGYNLDATEEERFAVRDGRIHKDGD